MISSYLKLHGLHFQSGKFSSNITLQDSHSNKDRKE